MADTAGAAGPAPFDIQSVPLRRRRGGGRPGRRQRGGAGHATIDLQGARRGIVTDAAPYLGDAAAVYSTGTGGVESYHYHRQDQTDLLYAQREDMQMPNPERAPQPKGPGQ